MLPHLTQMPGKVLGRLRRALRGPAVRFHGPYRNWADAAANCSGYDAAEIIARVTQATREVEAGRAAYERDSVLFDRIQYSWPLLASLLLTAAEVRQLRVIDFGGSLGSTYRQNRRFLDCLTPPPQWRVVEQPAFCAVGREQFATSLLSFHCTLEEAAVGGADAVLFCSSLCYLEDPWDALGRAAAVGAPYLIFDRLPVTPHADDQILVQHVSSEIYPASYPCWSFSESEFRRRLQEIGYRVHEEWICDLQAPGPFVYKGYLCRHSPHAQ